MSSILSTILLDDKAFKILKPFVKKAVGMINSGNQLKNDLVELEEEVKNTLGLPRSEFKKVVKFVMATAEDLPAQIDELEVIHKIVDRLNIN
jgi:hypothetical protein